MSYNKTGLSPGRLSTALVSSDESGPFWALRPPLPA